MVKINILGTLSELCSVIRKPDPKSRLPYMITCSQEQLILQVNSKRQRLGPESLGCDVAEGGVVVSVMLPTRQGLGAAEPSLTSVEQIYVVVLKPSKQYTTYACSLPKAMYV